MADLERLRYALRSAKEGCSEFRETMIIIGGKIYEATSSQHNMADAMRPHDMAYIEAQRLNILEHVLPQDTRKEIRDRLFHTCVEMLEDAISTFGVFSVEITTLQPNLDRLNDAEKDKHYRTQRLARQPPSFEEVDNVRVAVPKDANRTKTLDKIKKPSASSYQIPIFQI